MKFYWDQNRIVANSIDDFEYVISEDGKSAEIVGFKNNDEMQAYEGMVLVIDIPTITKERIPITRIHDRAFMGYTVGSYLIPSTVTYVGKDAFYWGRT